MKPNMKARKAVQGILKMLKEAGIEDVEKYRARFPALIRVPGIVDMADYLEQTVQIKPPRSRKCLAIHPEKDGKVLVDVMDLEKGNEPRVKLGLVLPKEQLGLFVTVMFKR